MFKDFMDRNLRGTDMAVLALLVLFSLVSKFYLLSSYPAPVFDEVGYIPQGDEMLSRSIIRSTHPPLGMFFVALGGRIMGKDTFGWRFFPVLFGTACIPLVFFLCRRLWKNSNIAVIASILVTFDPMFFVLSRLALLDIFACFFILLTALLYAYDRKVLCAVSMGCALCVKWISVLALLAVIVLIFLEFLSRRIKGRELLRSLLITVTVPFITYLILFALLYQCRNPEMFINYHRYFIARMAFVPVIGYLTTPWWSWLIIPQYLPLAEKQIASNSMAVLKLIEIPALLWAGVFAVILAALQVLKDMQGGEKSPLMVPLVSFLALYIPWGISSRATYLFYVFPAVPFLLIILAWALDTYLSESRYFTAARIIFVASVILSFFALYPHFAGWK